MLLIQMLLSWRAALGRSLCTTTAKPPPPPEQVWNWIQPYRGFILAHAPRLQAHGFILKGESTTSMGFESSELRLTFVAERYYGGLSTWVVFLADPPGNDEYRLDLVMGAMDGATFKDFACDSWQAQARVIAMDVDYVLANKRRLFGPRCTFAEEYAVFEKHLYNKLRAEWSAKP